MAFLKEADAIVLFPGGFGTLDEAMETLTLLQNGKHSPFPLILIEEPESGSYWESLIRFFKEELLSDGYISDGDFELFECVNSIDAAIDSINCFYSRYHSMRYVGEKLVVRLSSELNNSSLEEINKNFSDILVPGGRIYLSEALPDEADEPEIITLPRLVVDFNLQDFGRLRTLIDEINRC